jgi:hypothetical protein
MIKSNLTWYENAPVNKQVELFSAPVRSGHIVPRALFALLPYQNLISKPAVVDSDGAALVIFTPVSLGAYQGVASLGDIRITRWCNDKCVSISLTTGKTDLQLIEANDDVSLLPAIELGVDLVFIRYRSIQHLWSLCLRSMQDQPAVSSASFRMGDGALQWWLERECDKSNVAIADLLLKQSQVIEWIELGIRSHYLGGNGDKSLHELMDLRFIKY